MEFENIMVGKEGLIKLIEYLHSESNLCPSSEIVPQKYNIFYLKLVEPIKEDKSVKVYSVRIGVLYREKYKDNLEGLMKLINKICL